MARIGRARYESSPDIFSTNFAIGTYVVEEFKKSKTDTS